MAMSSPPAIPTRSLKLWSASIPTPSCVFSWGAMRDYRQSAGPGQGTPAPQPITSYRALCAEGHRAGERLVHESTASYPHTRPSLWRTRRKLRPDNRGLDSFRSYRGDRMPRFGGSSMDERCFLSRVLPRLAKDPILVFL